MAPRLPQPETAVVRQRILFRDVFLEAEQRSEDYSAERGSVRTWLLLRTRSRALDRLESTEDDLTLERVRPME